MSRLRPSSGITTLAVLALLIGGPGCSDTTTLEPDPDQGPGDQAVESPVSDTLADVGEDKGADIRADEGVDLAADMDEDTASTPDVSPDLGPPTGRCATAPAVALVSGSLLVTDDTNNYTDEFSGLACPSISAHSPFLQGPQAYFRFAATKDQWYRFTLTPQASAASPTALRLYVFTNKACTEAAIKADCAAPGTTGTVLPTMARSVDDPRAAYFKAPANDDIYVAVDSPGPVTDGRFTLEIKEITQPQNRTCASAAALTFTAGKATVEGDVHPLLTPDEFSGVHCSERPASSYDMDGGQVYYKFDATAGASYVITLEGESNADLFAYVFGDTCTEAAISADCASSGVSGVWADDNPIDATGKRSFLFSPAAAGTYTIAVDSNVNYGFGAFKLSVEEWTPNNGACASATPLSFLGGKTVVTGTTAGTINEHGTAITCVGSQPHRGPQAYYELDLKAGHYYTVSLDSAVKSLAWYIFQKPSCGTPTAIDSDCGAPGAFGRNGIRSFYRPTAAGKYLIAVDTTSATDEGVFNLTIEEHPLPTNDKACSALPVTVPTVIESNTAGAASEFTLPPVMCGGFMPMRDGQLYYEFTAAAGKGYRIRYTNKDYPFGHVYVFRKASCGARGTVDADCASKGVSGAHGSAVQNNSIVELLFAPTTPGPYVVAVNSFLPPIGDIKNFRIAIDEHDLLPNTTCATATALPLTGGQAEVSGASFFGADEFPTLKCKDQGGATSSNLDGPNVYYSVAMTAGKAYEIELQASFADAYLYVFDSSKACSETNIAADCQSGGASGDGQGPFATSGRIYFRPPSSGTYTIGIDSYDVGGLFTLKVREIDVPANTTCATAKALTFSGGVAQDSQTTAFAADEYATLQCQHLGTSASSQPLAGGQLYWSLNLDATKDYAVTVSATIPDGYLYIFDGSKSCSAANIETDCTSGGTSGLGFGPLVVENAKASYTLHNAPIYFRPPTSGVYKLAVDSYGAIGNVDVTVTELSRPANDTCASAEALLLDASGRATAMGFTSAAVDEFSAGVTCGGAALGAGQTYYKVTLPKGSQDYTVRVQADYAAALYAFPSAVACSASAINGVCGGVDGLVAKVGWTDGGSASFVVTTTAPNSEYIIVIDGETAAGGYTLEVLEGAGRVVIQEISTSEPEYAVLKNVGNAPIRLDNLVFEMGSAAFATGPVGKHVAMQLKNGATLAPGQEYTLVEAGAPPLNIAPDESFPTTLSMDMTTAFWALLCVGECKADGSNVIDAMRRGSSSIALPSGITFGPTHAALPTTVHWANVRMSYKGTSPAFLSDDWDLDLNSRKK